MGNFKNSDWIRSRIWYQRNKLYFKSRKSKQGNSSY